MTTAISTPNHQVSTRVWLAGTQVTPIELADVTTGPGARPTVRDDLMRVWLPSDTITRFRTVDGRHTASWLELRARFDLVEIEGVAR